MNAAVHEGWQAQGAEKLAEEYKKWVARQEEFERENAEIEKDPVKKAQRQAVQDSIQKEVDEVNKGVGGSFKFRDREVLAVNP